MIVIILSYVIVQFSSVSADIYPWNSRWIPDKCISMSVILILMIFVSDSAGKHPNERHNPKMYKKASTEIKLPTVFSFKTILFFKNRVSTEKIQKLMITAVRFQYRLIYDHFQIGNKIGSRVFECYNLCVGKSIENVSTSFFFFSVWFFLFWHF